MNYNKTLAGSSCPQSPVPSLPLTEISLTSLDSETRIEYDFEPKNRAIPIKLEDELPLSRRNVVRDVLTPICRRLSDLNTLPKPQNGTIWDISTYMEEFMDFIEEIYAETNAAFQYLDSAFWEVFEHSKTDCDFLNELRENCSVLATQASVQRNASSTIAQLFSLFNESGFTEESYTMNRGSKVAFTDAWRSVDQQLEKMRQDVQDLFEHYKRRFFDSRSSRKKTNQRLFARIERIVVLLNMPVDILRVHSTVVTACQFAAIEANRFRKTYDHITFP